MLSFWSIGKGGWFVGWVGFIFGFGWLRVW